jgi:hypothetical protein
MRNNDMSLVNACRRTARRTFGVGRLRPEQESAMLAVLKGRDALVMLPTGFGKSLIYQVPAMILERPTIVISPLVALMADQERALTRCGVPVVALHSRLRAAERRAALDKVESGGRLVVLTTDPPSSALDRHSSASTKRTASRSGGTIFGHPTWGWAPPASGWATRHRSPSPQPRRRVSAGTLQNGCASTTPS